jgi:hypothetical protein
MDHAAKRGQDLLIGHRRPRDGNRPADTRLTLTIKIEGNPMSRISAGLVAALLVAGTVAPVSAQTAAPATTTAPAAKPSKLKLTAEKLKDMKAKWSANKTKLKACRKDVKVKGLTGDDRWFYIEECMAKS